MRGPLVSLVMRGGPAAAFAVLLCLAAPAARAESPAAIPAVPPSGQWRGLHIKVPTHRSLQHTLRLCTDHLPALGVNILVVEVNYRYKWRSHPELSEGDLTFEDARKLTATCRAAGILVVPQFQCLGHQSWQRHRNALLARYPEFDESPDRPEGSIPARSWCPSHPGVKPLVFDLLDELVDAFQTPLLHVGLDEVQEIGRCSRCRGSSVSDLFSRTVVDLHDHLATRGVRMMMWADRLLDRKGGFGGFHDTSDSGTHLAIGSIPRDVVLCDWHYEPARSYASVPYLLGQGFQVWPSAWNSLAAARGMRDAGRKSNPSATLGMLYTCWSCGRGAPGLLRALLGKPDGSEFDKQAVEVLNLIRTLRREEKRRPNEVDG
jgi:hypothetical protein